MKKIVNEKTLSMRRAKERSVSVSLVYKLTAFGKLFISKTALLKFFLNTAWLTWRMAFELAGEIHGKEFHNHTKALNEDFLKRFLSAESTMIDIGCGNGRWCEIGAKYAKNVVGIDYDPGLIAFAKETINAANAEFIVGDVTKDLSGRSFDIALLIHVIEHIENADEFLVQLHSVANKLIVEVPDFENDALNLMRLEYGTRFYSDADHVREYTAEILTSQLDRNGWKILEIMRKGGAIIAVCDSGRKASQTE